MKFEQWYLDSAPHRFIAAKRELSWGKLIFIQEFVPETSMIARAWHWSTEKGIWVGSIKFDKKGENPQVRCCQAVGLIIMKRYEDERRELEDKANLRTPVPPDSGQQHPQPVESMPAPRDVLSYAKSIIAGWS